MLVKCFRAFASVFRKLKINLLFNLEKIFFQFRYELYIEGKTHLVASTYLVSFSLFSFFWKGTNEAIHSFVEEVINVCRTCQNFDLKFCEFSETE